MPILAATCRATSVADKVPQPCCIVAFSCDLGAPFTLNYYPGPENILQNFPVSELSQMLSKLLDMDLQLSSVQFMNIYF